jgi:hypothetical protein
MLVSVPSFTRRARRRRRKIPRPHAMICVVEAIGTGY